jgi:hypothetical protein
MKKTIFRNGIRHSAPTHQKAVQLRRKGWTHREIAKELKISLGSADLWTKGIVPSAKQKIAIEARRNQHVMTPLEKALAIERLRPFWPERKYADSDLIDRIKKFHAEHGRIPLKREFNALRIFRQRFGSWNNAIRIAGFEPNPVLFAKKFKSNDGHPCDSFTEKIIDDWLYENGISHLRNFKYIGTKMTADFFIEPNVILEFFGLAGVQKAYDEIIERKRLACNDLGLNLIEIYPRDIFPKNRLADLFNG